MPSDAKQRFDDNASLGRALGVALVHRGVLQHFFVGPMLPMGPLSLDEVGAAWSRWAAEVSDGRAPELLSLYVHIPFCSHRCRYCLYYSVGDFDPDWLDAYLERLHAEIDFYANRLKGVRFLNCYLGGGTPTVLSESQLAKLLDHVGTAFERQRGGEWAFECNPLSVSHAKARLFKDHGFNRVSFGVQTINRAVLAGVNRGYQSYQRVRDTFEVMQDLNFWINVDLIRGLPNETPESMQTSLEEILKLHPTQVTIYALSPYTPIDLDFTALPPIAEALPALQPLLARYGYRGAAGTTCLGITRSEGPHARETLLDAERTHTEHRCNYDDTTVEPFSLLGLGPTARGYIYGQLRYMNDRYPVDTPFGAREMSATGRQVTMAEEQRRFVVHQLEKGGLDPDAFRALFGIDVPDAFGRELEQLSTLGLLAERDGVFRLTCSDLLERFAAELFFVDQDMLDAAWRSLEEPVDPPQEDALESAGEPERIDAQDEWRTLRVAGSGVAIDVIVASHQPEQPAYHRTGEFVFFVPSSSVEGIAELEVDKERLLRAFARQFERVVRARGPAAVPELVAALEEEVRGGEGLTVVRTSGPS